MMGDTWGRGRAWSAGHFLKMIIIIIRAFTKGCSCIFIICNPYIHCNMYYMWRYIHIHEFIVIWEMTVSQYEILSFLTIVDIWCTINVRVGNHLSLFRENIFTYGSFYGSFSQPDRPLFLWNIYIYLPFPS